MKRYYAIWQQGKEASINIFGDITSIPYKESNVSSYSLSEELGALDVEVLHVHINSYGGEVAEGLAIYNSLKGHKAKVITYCDGFACSAASTVFMAGNERVMQEASLLMIHNAWSQVTGNATDMRKTAEELEIISQTAANVYRNVIRISDDDLQKMLENETWITPSEALEMGFATAIMKDNDNTSFYQSTKGQVVGMAIKQWKQSESFPKENIVSESAKTEPPKTEPPKENTTLKFLQALMR